MEYLTMSDINLSGKTVLVRLDLNSPMDDGKILDDKRFRSHLETLEGLKDSKTVLMSHQGRAGGKDFTTMQAHKQKLSELMGRKIKYIDDIFGSHARNEIKNMKSGDILLLENLRFYSEESLKRPPEEHAETHLVKNLAPCADIFINDAFSTSHRSHLSIVGFTPVLPSFAGRLMEKEIIAHEKVLKTAERPCTFVLGGIKVDDSIKVTKNVLEKGIADRVLLTGLVANVFLAASGTNIGKSNLEFIHSQGYDDQIDVAKDILKQFEEKIMLPVDFGLNKDGKRDEVDSGIEVNYPIQDLGSKTIVLFTELISGSKTVVVNGPAGVFEDKEFSKGTYEILKSVSECDFGVVGGGHITAALGELGIEDKMWHVSTGGGACISYLSGEKLPGVYTLKKNK